MSALRHGVIEKALVDWIELSTGLSRASIRFRDQKALEPLDAYCELYIDGLYSRSSLDETVTESNEDDPPTVKITKRGPRRMQVFVEFFTTNKGREEDAMALCTQAQSHLQNDTMRERLAESGMVPGDTGHVYKRSQMKGTEWEHIAKLDVQFRVTSEVSENLETIEHVTLSSTELGLDDTTVDL